MAPGPGCENVTLQQSRHLLDDSVLEDRLTSDATSTGSSDGGNVEFGNGGFATGGAASAHGGECSSGSRTRVAHGFQGCVRRKTVLKDGRKPAVASWQRYWLQIWANSLVYFPPKSFKG